LNSVVSAFYYVRVLKAMFLRDAGPKQMAAPDRGIALPIVVGTIVVAIFGLMPDSLIGVLQGASVPMLTSPARVPYSERMAAMEKAQPNAPRPEVVRLQYSEEQLKKMANPASTKGGDSPKSAPAKKKGTPAKKQAMPSEKQEPPPTKQATPATTKSN
jgi:hypothetical protein